MSKLPYEERAKWYTEETEYSYVSKEELDKILQRIDTLEKRLEVLEKTPSDLPEIP